MSKTVWKYPLTPAMPKEAPAGALALSVQLQDGVPTVWVLVDPEQPMEPFGLQMIGTGWRHPEPVGRYVGTFQLPGPLVFHVFQDSPLRIVSMPMAMEGGPA